MSRSLSVLVLEDSEVDCELIVRKLNKEGSYRTDHARVQSLAGLQAALDRQDWDIILSDHSMPQFSALNALQELQQRKLDTPVIILSGTIEASEAVAAMKAGAADFIMKDDMTRLLPAIARELREAESRREGRLSEAKLAEKTAEMLREQEKFRQIIQAIEEVVWLTNHDLTEVIYVSPAYEKIWGRTCESLYKSPDDWAKAVPPAERDQVVKDVQTVLAVGGDTEFRILRPDETLRWVKVTGFPIKEASGQINRVAGITTDITKEKQLQAQYLQSQKLEAIGKLAGGVAHDFNNILTAIMGYANFLANGPTQNNTWREDVEEIKKAAERAAALTRQLLAFSRQQVLQLKVVDLNAEISDLKNMLWRLVGEDIEWTVSLAPALGYIKADPVQIQQVLMNLVVNARDAMPNGGKLAISTENVKFQEPQAENDSIVPAGAYVTIVVSDNGVGMNESIKARIFEPFFTTKEKGKGTGLGLAVIYGIVEQSGGYIILDSTPNKGTTFKIYFPTVDGVIGGKDEDRVAQESSRGTETILVVDDDEAIRSMLLRILRQHGYATLEAGSGEEALKLVQAHKGNLHLLLSDMVLPAINGLDLARQISSVRPEIKVILISGYLDKEFGNFFIDEKTPFLQKPFGPAAVAKLVREVLNTSTKPNQEARCRQARDKYS